jgi:hypothetical protein
MDEVTGLLESELAALFTQESVVDCAVLPGGATEERPDEYLSIVAVDSEYRVGNSWIVEVEFRCVVPLDDVGAAHRQKIRLRSVVDFINDPNSPVRTYQSSTLAIYGLVLRKLISQIGERSRAEIVRVRFGAAATGFSGAIAYVVS